MRYVALGDSYTIGTGTRSPQERWPDQLVRRLTTDGIDVELVANLGVNGYTSADVIRSELPRLAELDPGFATLLVGVNDVVQAVPEATYAANVASILDRLLGLVPASRIATVSTPDYTVTPQGAAYGDPAHQSAAIRRVNQVLAGLAEERGISHVDIHDLSLLAASDPGLVAEDGLHPSGRQYELWVDRIAPVVERRLRS